ncbi:hypothetical protein OC845_006380, partial [Tilletia horrida]
MSAAREPAIFKPAANPDQHYEELRKPISQTCGITLPRPAQWTSALWSGYRRMVSEEEQDRLADKFPARKPPGKDEQHRSRRQKIALLQLAHKYLTGIDHSGFDQDPPVSASHSPAALAQLAENDHHIKQFWRHKFHSKPFRRPQPSKAAPPPPPPLPPPPGQGMQDFAPLRLFSSTEDARGAGTALLLLGDRPAGDPIEPSLLGQRALPPAPEEQQHCDGKMFDLSMDLCRL